MIEEGPWLVAFGNNRVCIESDDFTHDAQLCVTGDFESGEQRVKYAEEVARRLNAFTELDELREQVKLLRDAITEGLSTYKVPMTARLVEALAATEKKDSCCGKLENSLNERSSANP